VLRFDGRQVGISGDLPRFVGSTRPGARVPVQVWRKGGQREMQVVVAELPDDRAKKPVLPMPRPEVAPNKLGIVVADPNQQQRRDGRLASGGVVVEALRSASARASEIQAGDAILAIINRVCAPTCARRISSAAWWLPSSRARP
jgi:serine protease Do